MADVNYDFIIVGAGASGSALASKLARKGPTLLIERGANHTSIPQSAVRQGYPEVTSLGIEPIRNNGSGHWTGTAHILGGGTSINAGVCWRSEESLFDEIGFKSHLVERSFKSLEDSVCLPSLPNKQVSQFNQAFIDAWKEQGFEYLQSASGLGSWAHPWSNSTTIQRARTLVPPGSSRRTANFLFEDPNHDEGASIRNQGNLTVFLLTKVKRVLFNDNKDAVGIEIRSPAGDLNVYVRDGGKVFLNAGVYETPKLLMLSGIGPPTTLSKYNIPIIFPNEHVGQHLIDRKVFSILIPLLRSLEGDGSALLDVALIAPEYYINLANKHTEWATAFNGCVACHPKDRTEQCYKQLVGAMIFSGAGRNHIETRPTIPLIIYQRHPKTRGNVTLSSADFNDPPIVHDGGSKKYSEMSSDAKDDFEVLVDAAQDLTDFLRNTSFLYTLGHAKIGSPSEGSFDNETISALKDISTAFSLADKTIDKCMFTDSIVNNDVCTTWDECLPTVPSLPSTNDREKLRKLVFELRSSSFHMAGTCKVGTVVEKGSLKVKGVNGLYVSDLSILPRATDIHPQMAAMSLGLLFGDSVGVLSSGENYEVFPIALTVVCLVVVVIVMVAWTHTKRSSQGYKKVISEEDGDSINVDTRRRPTLSNIWGDSNDSPDSYMDRTIMSWEGVSCSYVRKKREEPITTLFNSFGVLKKGEITAILGPSGASKSTLLDILSGRKSVGDVGGTFSVLGSHFDAAKDGLSGLSKAIQGSSVYIPQQEFFYPTQTCEEAVAFTADMKYGRVDKTERRQRVHACLDVVGLPSDTFASRQIGGDLHGGYCIRGLSGGERKRLALACALALRPKIMFIDELTSGLDSENTVLIMRLLKRLSVRMRVASIIIIHQPDPETFSLFDRLILLSKGRSLFSGDCQNLGQFYEQNYDENLPNKYILSGDLVAKASAFNILRDNDDSYFKGEDEGAILMTDYDYEGRAVTQRSLYAASTLFKLQTVFHRNLMNQYVRNITNVLARFASYTCISIFVGWIFWQSGRPESEAGITFQEADMGILRASLFLMNISYLLPFASIPVFVCDKRFFAAEAALGLYPSWIYGLSQTFLEFVFLTLSSTVEAVIVIPTVHIVNPTYPEWVNFLSVTSIIILSGLVGSCMVFCASIWLPTQDLAFLLSSSLVTIFLSISGGFLPFTSMPSLPSFIQWISPIKYSFQALVISELKGTTAEKVIDIGGYNTPSTVTENLLVLFGFFLLFSTLSIIGMARVKEVR